MNPNIIISKYFKSALAMAMAECQHDKIFVLTDKNTYRLCWQLIKDYFSLKGAIPIIINVGDQHKNLETLTYVWTILQDKGATRHSLLINLGGGMVTDLGGFAASTFKRGINFINIPTTLLAMVDASVGGKTGINFRGMKNEIGVFNDPQFVILNTDWLKTLDQDNILSGYAEMIKHGLICNKQMWAELLNFDISHLNLEQLSVMLEQSVSVKESFVTQDPHEKGIRKALNFGHTFGHAMESWAIQHHPILHGYAVAFGMIAELYLSTIKVGFPTTSMRQTISFLRENYGTLPITCNDYSELIRLMRHDKKNRANEINVTLLSDIGDIRINQNISEEEIKETLDFFRDGL